MATIYQKQTGDKTLILDPREALVIPFDFGTGWKTVTAGVFFSVVGLSGDNSIPPYSEQVTNIASPKNNFWMGFTSYQDPFPYNSSNTFIGYCPQFYKNIGISAGIPTYCQLGTTTDGAGFFSSDGSMTRIGLVEFVNSGIKLTPLNNTVQYDAYGTTSAPIKSVNTVITTNPTGSTGSAYYASQVGFTLSIDPSTKLYTGWHSNVFALNQPSITELNVNFLRKQLSTVTTTIKTGYYTIDGTASSTLASPPNAFILYSPMYLSRVRVHNAVVSQVS